MNQFNLSNDDPGDLRHRGLIYQASGNPIFGRTSGASFRVTLDSSPSSPETGPSTQSIAATTLVNGEFYFLPAPVADPLLRTSASFAAKIVNESGGFIASADDSITIGQLLVYGVCDLTEATRALVTNEAQIIALANSMRTAGDAGYAARWIVVRLLPGIDAPSSDGLLAVDLMIEAGERVAADKVDRMTYVVAPLVETLTGGNVLAAGASAFSDDAVTRAECTVPIERLCFEGVSEGLLAEAVLQASRFSCADRYRAASHNMSVLDGIEPISYATDQDWRAIETGAHAYAARFGRYRPLTTWNLEEGALVGRIEVPIQVRRPEETAGYPSPALQAMRAMGIGSARSLAMVMCAAGLRHNLAALIKLSSATVAGRRFYPVGLAPVPATSRTE